MPCGTSDWSKRIKCILPRYKIFILIGWLQCSSQISFQHWTSRGGSTCMQPRSITSFIDSKGQLLTKWNIERAWFITSNCFSTWVVWYFVRLVLFVKYIHLLQVSCQRIFFILDLCARMEDGVVYLYLKRKSYIIMAKLFYYTNILKRKLVQYFLQCGPEVFVWLLVFVSIPIQDCLWKMKCWKQV